MNNKPTPQMIDGKPGLLAFAQGYHHRHIHRHANSAKLLRKVGFELTGIEEDYIDVLGPLQTTTRIKTMALYGGGPGVRHIELIRGLERLLEVGVPVWKSEAEQFAWHLQQLEQCDPFQVPVLEEFETREEMDDHLEGCQTCQPASKLLIEAISHGSKAYSDTHVRALIERSHADQTGAVAYYTQLRDAHRAPFLPAEKPQRTKREQVPA